MKAKVFPICPFNHIQPYIPFYVQSKLILICVANGSQGEKSWSN